MGVGRDYQRRAHHAGALYARSAVSPDQKFIAYVDDPGNILQPEVTLNLGTRHSANGLCTVTVSQEDERFPASDLSTNRHSNGHQAIQLLSDAIIPGKSGGYLRGLDSNGFEFLSGCKVTVIAAYSSWKIVGGWSGRWNLPRESAIAIEAGSVWLVGCATNDQEKWTSFLDDCQTKGLGDRTYEGFGTILKNPKWLSSRYVKDVKDIDRYFLEFGYKKSGTPEISDKPINKIYSGLANVPTEKLDMLLGLAQDPQNATKSPGKVRDWITAIARDLEQVNVFLQQPSQSVLRRKIEQPGSILPDWTRDAMLFYLSARECELKKPSEPGPPSMPGEEA